jgi:hypothetical protein
MSMEESMVRVTALALGIAVTLGACGGGDHQASNVDSAMGNVAANTDTAVSGATNTAAGALDTAGQKVDTAANTMGANLDTAANKVGANLDTAANKAKGAAGEAAGAVGSTASSAAIRVKLGKLSQDQVTQLQTALTSNGCDAGQADGHVGSKTVDAVKCGLQKNNIDDTDLDALYKALDLNFGS